MSLGSGDGAEDDVVEPKICDTCGLYITEPDQRCPALHDGRCRT